MAQAAASTRLFCSSNEWNEGLGERVQRLVQDLQDGLGTALRLGDGQGASCNVDLEKVKQTERIG